MNKLQDDKKENEYKSLLTSKDKNTVDKEIDQLKIKIIIELKKEEAKTNSGTRIMHRLHTYTMKTTRKPHIYSFINGIQN